MESTISEKANYWATSQAFDGGTNTEIQSLIDAGDDKELTERFYKDLEFGTGGLRGILGAGTSRMNIFNIRKATTALAIYLNEVYKDAPEKRVAISYDSRQFSKEFSEAAAEVLAAHNIRSYITKDLRPVPMLSFMTRHFECHAGICVTASHNPPDYNGFKVYWTTGGQLVPPHDKKIIANYQAITDYADLKFKPYKDAVTSKKIIEVGDSFDEEYFKRVKALTYRTEGNENLKIVYTPLHGAGLYPVTEMLKRSGFENVLVVPEQEKPDGKFPTVSSPNPENESAMEMALALGRKEGADLIMATDPDCDRIGMYIKEGDDYFRPNGNQIGCLLNDFILSSLKDSGKLPENPLIIKTIVTTELQKDIAKQYGAKCLDTLTGFKWICQVIEEYETGLRKPYAQFICGGEESYGFMAGDFVRDKDGVISCCVAAQMTAYYKSKGTTPSQVLREMYKKHGAYYETLYNLVLPGKNGADAIAAMMKSMREDPTKEIAGVAVDRLDDIQTSKEMTLTSSGYEPTGEIDLPKSNVLQFYLMDGTKVSVRPSGTEPKIKFYISVKNSDAIGASDEQVDAALSQCKISAKRIEEIFVAMAR